MKIVSLASAVEYQKQNRRIFAECHCNLPDRPAPISGNWEAHALLEVLSARAQLAQWVVAVTYPNQ